MTVGVQHQTGKHSLHRRSLRAERAAADVLGGRVLSASGAKPWSHRDGSTRKGDFRTPDLHVEHKRTEALEMRVQREWLRKVAQGGRLCTKIPALVVLIEPVPEPVREWLFIPVPLLRNRDAVIPRLHGEVLDGAAHVTVAMRARMLVDLGAAAEAAGKVPGLILCFSSLPEEIRQWVGVPIASAREVMSLA